MRQQINLYLPEYRLRQDPLTPRRVVAGLVVVLALLVLLSALAFWQRGSARSELEALRAELAAEQQATAQLLQTLGAQTEDTALLQTMNELEENLQNKQVLLDFLQGRELGNAEGFSEYLAELSRRLVPGLRLTAIELTDGGRQVRLRGQVERPDNVTRYLQRLGGGEPYAGKNFETLRIEEDNGQEARPELFSFDVLSAARLP